MTLRTLTASILALTLAGPLACATYTGQEISADRGAITREPGWIQVSEVPLVRQRADWDCGIAALSMILQYWAIERDKAVVQEVVEKALKEERAIRAGELRTLARAHGAEAFLFHGTMEDLTAQLAKGRPVLVGEMKPTMGGSNAHYAVVVGVHPGSRRVLLLDPAHGVRENTFEGFDEEWAAAGRLTLLVLGTKAPLAAADPAP